MPDGIASDPPSERPSATGAASTPVPWFQRVTYYSVLAGLCPLIPVPFLDDRVLDAVKRRMVTALARERGVTLSERQRDFLAGAYKEPRGCLERIGRLAFKLTVKLVAKLFRKILVFLALKEAVDVASRTFHEGYLLHLLFDPTTQPTWAGAGERPEDAEGEAWRARWAIQGAVGEVDPRPVDQAIRRAFRGSRGLLGQAAKALGRQARSGGDEARVSAVEAEEAERLSGVLGPLAADLWTERGYLSALESRFRNWYRAARAPEA